MTETPIRVDKVSAGATCSRCGAEVTCVNVYASERSRFGPCEHFGAPNADFEPSDQAAYVHRIDESGIVRNGADVLTYKIDYSAMRTYDLGPLRYKVEPPAP